MSEVCGFPSMAMHDNRSGLFSPHTELLDIDHIPWIRPVA
jgi:hypothetical protein